MEFAWPEARHIYLSPHLDDVILSCGGRLYEQALRAEAVAVVTVFAGSPAPGHELSGFARSLHERWQASAPAGTSLTDPPAARRREDRAAFAAISPAIQVVHHTLPDCIYRTHPTSGKALYAGEAALFGAVHPNDPAILMLGRVGPPPGETLIYAPAGVGHHVDHQVVGRWVESWKLPPGRVVLFEDYPYAAVPGAVDEAALRQAGWQPDTARLSEAALAAKTRAVAEYHSQISTFWGSVEEMAQALRGFAAQTGGERVWVGGSFPHMPKTAQTAQHQTRR